MTRNCSEIMALGTGLLRVITTYYLRYFKINFDDSFHQTFLNKRFQSIKLMIVILYRFGSLKF